MRRMCFRSHRFCRLRDRLCRQRQAYSGHPMSCALLFFTQCPFHWVDVVVHHAVLTLAQARRNTPSCRLFYHHGSAPPAGAAVQWPLYVDRPQQPTTTRALSWPAVWARLRGFHAIGRQSRLLCRHFQRRASASLPAADAVARLAHIDVQAVAVQDPPQLDIARGLVGLLGG